MQKNAKKLLRRIELLLYGMLQHQECKCGGASTQEADRGIDPYTCARCDTLERLKVLEAEQRELCGPPAEDLGAKLLKTAVSTVKTNKSRRKK